MVDIATFLCYNARMVFKFIITFKQDGDPKKPAQTTVNAHNSSSAKMKFVEQGYGLIADIIDIEQVQLHDN